MALEKLEKTREEGFQQIEETAHQKLMALPKETAFTFLSMLIGLDIEGEKEKAYELFSTWFTAKRTVEDITKQIRTEDPDWIEDEEE